MNPILRVWGIAAMWIALACILRGAWPLAFACFLLSPAPVLAFARHHPDVARLSRSWLAACASLIVLAIAFFVAVAYFGGIPPVHEWRSTMQAVPAEGRR